MRRRHDDGAKSENLRRLILLCCVPALVIALVVYAAYFLGDCLPLIVTPWAGGEFLSYCGAFAAAAIAIFGVYLSLDANRRDLEGQTRVEAAPFFSIVFLEQVNKRDCFSEMLVSVSMRSKYEGDENAACEDDASQARDNEHEEIEHRAVYAILGDDISYQKNLTEDQVEHVQSRNLKQEVAKGSIAIVVNPVIYIPIRLMNVGKGTAVSTRVGINPVESDWAGVEYWTVEPGDFVYLGICIDTDIEAVFGEYELRAVYYDCLGCQHIQKFDLNVVRNGEDECPAVQMAYYGQRRLLSDEERERMLKSEEDSSKAVFS